MGARVCGSNSTQALATPGVTWANALSSPWWVVAMVEAAAAQQVLEDGLGQRRALRGVGAGAQLVEQDEASAVEAAPRMEMMFPMWELKVESDCSMRLLVADVGVDGLEDGQAGVGVGGDGQAGLGHEGEQPDGLEGDGLAAGVGAGDEQDAEGVLPRGNRNGTRLALAHPGGDGDDVAA